MLDCVYLVDLVAQDDLKKAQRWSKDNNLERELYVDIPSAVMSA